MGQIQAIFFDVGSTLLYPSPTEVDTFYSIACERGHRIEKQHIQESMPKIYEFYEAEYLRDGDFWCSRERAAGIWLDMYRYLAHLVGLEKDAEYLAQKVYAAYSQADHWAIYQDVRPVLYTLKQRGLRLSVISNWDDGLENILRGVGLLPYFDDVVSSAVVGYRKPDHVIFDIALERLDVAPSNAVHVGDLPDADGYGAFCAGIRPLIIDRTNVFLQCPYQRMESLLELPNLIA